MSIHKSKGLQADYVFIIGLNEGVIPNDIRGIDTIEAQRRLLFVGMTRALKRLFMISTVEWEGKYVHKVDKSQFKYKCVKKLYYGKTSRFVGEMKA
jgi:superfamily I DNA/RNA helicase